MTAKEAKSYGVIDKFLSKKECIFEGFRAFSNIKKIGISDIIFALETKTKSIMRIVPVVSAESYILGKLIAYALFYGLPFMIVASIVTAIVEFVREAVAAFLASAFYAHLVAMWDSIIAFFDAYGWILVLAFSIIGFITTIALLYYGIRAVIEWITDKYYDLKYAIKRK